MSLKLLFLHNWIRLIFLISIFFIINRMNCITILIKIKQILEVFFLKKIDYSYIVWEFRGNMDL